MQVLLRCKEPWVAHQGPIPEPGTLVEVYEPPEEGGNSESTETVQWLAAVQEVLPDGAKVRAARAVHA